MSRIVNHSNGHGYLSLTTGDNETVIRVDEDMKNFMKRNQSKIHIDVTNNTIKYCASTGKQTTLARHLYTTYKGKRASYELGRVKFKNGNTSDYRLDNLTTK